MLHLREAAAAAEAVPEPEGGTVAADLTKQQSEIADGGQGEMEDPSSGSNKNQCLNSEEEEEDSWSEPG